MSGLIWIQTVWHFESDDIELKEFLEKVEFEKKNRRQISMLKW